MVSAVGTSVFGKRYADMASSPSPPSHQPGLRHLEQLMAQLLDGVIVMDPAGTILTANPAALRMHGIERVEDLGGTAEGYAERFSLRSADNRPLQHRHYPLFRLLAGDSFPDLIVEVAPAGEDDTRWVHQVRDVIMDTDGGEPDYLALVISDVSERFDAEARFAAMFRSNPAPALIVRLRDQRIDRANPGFLALTGFTAEQLEEKPLFGLDLLGGLSDPDAVRGALETGAILPQGDAELLVADGSRRLVVFAGQPIDVTGEDALLLTFADLEPRRQAEQALAASERHLSAVFEMAPVAMAITRDETFRTIAVNAAFRRLTDHDGDEAIDGDRLWHDDTHRAALIGQLRDRGRVRAMPLQVRTRGDAILECLVSAETISVDGAKCLLWVYEDVTERRRSEAELAQAIGEVMKDTSWLSRSILDRLATLRRGEPAAPTAELSAREREILDLICDDLDDAAIAQRLAIARNTVRNHVARLYAKIGVNRRSGAVVWGRERGMGTRQG